MYRLSALARPTVKGCNSLPRLAASFSTTHGYNSPKEIKTGTEARSLMLSGVDQLADTVAVTLGPKVSYNFDLSCLKCCFCPV